MLQYWFLPVVGAFIGWLTNILAIKSLFRPTKPIKILFWTFQGLLPRYKDDLAEKVGQTLEENILVFDEMAEHWQSIGLENEVEKIIADYIKEKTKKWLIFVPDNFHDRLINGFKRLVRDDLELGLQRIRDSLTKKLLDGSKLGELVTEKIKSLDIREIEELVLQVVARELRHVELLGGVLGFIIGLGQLLIVTFMS